MNEKVEASGTDDEVNAAMTIALDHGVVVAGSLSALEQVVHEVYLPLIAKPTAGRLARAETSATIQSPSAPASPMKLPAEPPSPGAPPAATEQILAKAGAMNSEQMLDVVEFVGNLQKFEQQLSHCLQQLTGDTRLNVPAITVDDPQAFADEKPDLVLQLEAAVEEWTPAIAAAVQAQEGKTKVGRGPLAEIEFWRARNAALSSLYEQLNARTRAAWWR